MRTWRLDTLAAHLGREGRPGPLVEPIAVSSTYALKDAGEGARFAETKAPRRTTPAGGPPRTSAWPTPWRPWRAAAIPS